MEAHGRDLAEVPLERDRLVNANLENLQKAKKIGWRRIWCDSFVTGRENRPSNSFISQYYIFLGAEGVTLIA